MIKNSFWPFLHLGHVIAFLDEIIYQKPATLLLCSKQITKQHIH